MAGRREDPRPLLVGHETNGRFLQTSPPATNMLLVSPSTPRLGEAPASRRLLIAMPYASLESSIKKAPAQGARGARVASPVA